MSDAQELNSNHWYLVQVRSRFEDKVAAALEVGILLQNLTDRVFQVLVPKETIKTKKEGKTLISQKPLYPGYVMVRALMDDSVWHFVKKIPGVSDFVGGSRPTTMSKAEVNRIFDLIKISEEAPKPKQEFLVGASIRLKSGSFKDFNATVEQVDYSKNRLKASILIFGRSTPVDVSFSEVEPV